MHYPTRFTRRGFVLSALSTAALASTALSACGGEDAAPAPLKNSYARTNLAATGASYRAQFTLPGMVDAWGIAIRPAGAGGHFWVGGGGVSWQFVGDVQSSPDASLRKLFQDDLKEVSVPAADALSGDESLGKITGVVFNGAELSSALFPVNRQTVTVGSATTAMNGSARFVFVTDSGSVSAWTDRTAAGAILRRDGASAQVYDGKAEGMAFFGAAIKTGTWDTLWLADFGASPQIRTLNSRWELVPTRGFANPFATGAAIDAADASQGKAPLPGDYVPFNIQVLTVGGSDYAFVAYAKSLPDTADPSAFYAAEEDAVAAADDKGQPDRGRVAMFDLAGKLLRVFEDDKRLNAPWGLAVAPATGFGKLSGKLLVGNFGGTGRVSAYDITTGKYTDTLAAVDGKPLLFEGLWALQFGNGVSLGDSNALYFAAGPVDETEGVFGSIRYLT